MQRDSSEPENDVRPPPADPPAAVAKDVESLDFSDREREIAELLVEGLTNKEIAEQLFLSTETIKSYVARILRKLGARNRVQAAVQLARGAALPAAPPERDRDTER